MKIASLFSCFILLLLPLTSLKALSMHEASMNFDLENVTPFLTGLEAQAKLGLPVSELIAFTKDTTVGKERSKHLRVTFHGSTVDLEYRVFMDDVDSPDIYFLTSSNGLAEFIQAEMHAFASKLGL